MINSPPLGCHKTLSDYTQFLLKRFISPHLTRGSKEVHIVFDTPGMLPNTPKQFEQQRRDKTANITLDHYCDDITNASTVQTKKWRDKFISCRVCKRKLVEYLGKSLLNRVKSLLTTNQIVYVAGATDDGLCWYVQGNSNPQPEPQLRSNAEETDTRAWLHVNNSTHSRVLVESCDTDVYHIGLPLQCVHQKEIVIRISPYNAHQLKYLNLTNLVDTLSRDQDLAGIDPMLLPQMLQTMYVVTGCDYTSFFSQIGKGTFLANFFQYASFITAGNKADSPGTLACTDLQEGLSSHKLGSCLSLD